MIPERSMIYGYVLKVSTWLLTYLCGEHGSRTSRNDDAMQRDTRGVSTQAIIAAVSDITWEFFDCECKLTTIAASKLYIYCIKSASITNKLGVLKLLNFSLEAHSLDKETRK